MLGQLNMYGMDKVEVSIERLKAFEPEEGYFLAFSGGKDSCVIKALADMAEVKYDAHYTVTSVDPPELVQFIKKYHPDVSMDIPRYPDDYKNEKLRGKQITMWNLIPEKKMPPTRIVRYCCATLKEPHGEGRFVVTGVRHLVQNSWTPTNREPSRKLGGTEQSDLVPASIEVHDKKITAVPRWDDSSTGEEVMNWWIK